MPSFGKIKLRTVIISGSVILASLVVGLTIFVAVRLGIANFYNTQNYSCTDSNLYSRECLLSYAKNADVDVFSFMSCIDKKEKAQSVSENVAAAKSLGLQAPPSAYIAKSENGKFHGFNIGGLAQAQDLTDLVHEAQTYSISETRDYWYKKQLTALTSYQSQIRDYFASSQGGSLTGADLDKAVKDYMDQQKQLLDDFTKIQDLDPTLGYYKGGGEAAVVLFVDYEAPETKQLEELLLKPAIGDLINEKNVRVEYVEFPQDANANAEAIAEAMKCAGSQGKYFEFQSQILNVQ